MNTILPVITGIGSVTPYGPLAGLIPEKPLEPTAITAWSSPGLRRAFQVEPFRPASIVPGVKTRRLDRLSTWALVAASLALKDAGVDLSLMDRSRIAVFFASGFGCVELTAAFYQSAATNGWAGTDPITFPETLGNSPASHVALFHDLHGPNVTVSSKNFAAESALLQATSLLRHGQADMAVVLAGETLTQAVYEWYEVAQLLSPACVTDEPASSGFIPSEGMVAMVLEGAARPEAHRYATVDAGRWAARGGVQAGVHSLLGDERPELTICTCNGAPCDSAPLACLAREVAGDDTVIYPAQAVAAGLGDAGGLMHLLLALSRHPEPGKALMLGRSAHGGYAALRLELL